MEYTKETFLGFSPDAQRLAANLEQAYQAWAVARRQYAALPVSMYWHTKASNDYLLVKADSASSGKSLGPRSEATEALLTRHTADKLALKERVRQADDRVAERASLCRRLRLPAMADQQAEILRALDLEELLGTDFMVVGTNAFVAYQAVCGVHFPTGNEETEDFDLTWCRGSKASLLSQGAVANLQPATTPPRKNLLGVLHSIDTTYAINSRKPYQAVNQAGYEVELLAAPSRHPLPPGEAFQPMASLIEQEWLLQGRPLATVVATLRGRACPLVVPDPRWMALHKMWLARKPERNPNKRDKDARQGEVLLDAVRHFLPHSHPLNVNFVLDLPEDLRPTFDRWAAERHFVPET
jgi:hypothetical protein